MSLTIAQFSVLTEVQKLELIVKNAVILGERRDNVFEYVLYDIDGLYVEEIRGIHYTDWYQYTAIDDMNLVLPYTEEIQVVFE
ncbi:hypothetical protein [Agriterribacter sp.]|uniref:hypothetical protein n=1 Tax=Agriterribacter sp. TaxID=2821509 RepID=UPI002D0F0CA2|nr:hypothetical protein [Agriterribacter sp.]HRO46689.1 hypothetical protein [Agriterribacter sp.]